MGPREPVCGPAVSCARALGRTLGPVRGGSGLAARWNGWGIGGGGNPGGGWSRVGEVEGALPGLQRELPKAGWPREQPPHPWGAGDLALAHLSDLSPSLSLALRAPPPLAPFPSARVYPRVWWLCSPSCFCRHGRASIFVWLAVRWQSVGPLLRDCSDCFYLWCVSFIPAHSLNKLETWQLFRF